LTEKIANVPGPEMKWKGHGFRQVSGKRVIHKKPSVFPVVPKTPPVSDLFQYVIKKANFERSVHPL